MTITWTKSWAGSDDGTILKGTDLKNIQEDLSNVLTETEIDTKISDAISQDDIVTWENEIIVYENSVVRVG